MEKTIVEIYNSIKFFKDGKNNLQPTLLYNEGWMLRLVLKWFNDHKEINYIISMKNESNWFSEALLKPKFIAMEKGDKLAERHTHADGIYGNFKIGGEGFGDAVLNENCNQFYVIEAKMFSELSPGVTNAPNYNQASRNVACICNLIPDGKTIDTGFFVIIPESQIENEKTFKEFVDKEHIVKNVGERISQYNGRNDFSEKETWYKSKFLPFMETINIKLLTWEEIIKFIKENDPIYGSELEEFYKQCIYYNRYSKILYM